MAQSEQNHPNQSGRGFASMDERKQRGIASKGGQSVPDEKRSFSRDHELAAEAGRKGGQSVPDEKRSFSQNHELASEAGRKGGQQSHGGSAGGAPRGGSGNFAEDRQRASEAGRKGGQH
ncbi:stress-induced protein [Roseomonas hellenica]|uniref:Stress-induced protein n=1 Tax=Plastoroseomonas hellenica TaxID=2687306 RepID=A0ABS5F4G1_9PROT|nr:KGG domain-containing protein [Plastoroseomonas hellenica]MBR0667391.1 stress-induced protein [Plastoroseomonas hellenica]